MKLLLDTHMVAWLAGNRSRLRPREREAIELHADRLLISAVSIWELRIRWRSNPRRAAEDRLIEPASALRFCVARGVEVLPFTAETAAALLVPPLDHGDPFDEVLLVQAQQAQAKLLTRDRHLLAHPLAYQP